MGNSDQLKQLKQRPESLSSKQQRLEQGRCLYSTAVLAALSECFELMAVDTQGQGLTDDQHHVEHLLQLRAELEELALCQPEQQKPSAASQQDPQATQATALQQEQDVQRIAPRHEPLAYFKHLVTQQAVQDAANMTAKDLAGAMRETVLRSSLELQRTKMQRLPADAQALQHVWDRTHLCLMSAIIHGRPELIAQVNSYNLQDLTDAPDSLPANVTKQSERIPAVLGLTQQQLQDIKAGSALFSCLMQGILDEQRQAQAQCNSSSADSSSISSSSSSSDSLDSLQQDNDAEQNKTRRMQVLQRKEFVVRAATAAWLAGCLSWEQYTTASIAAWPSVLLVTQLAVAIPGLG